MVDFNEIIEFSEDDIETLKHYGVKGMRWGIRKHAKVIPFEKATDKKISKVTKRGKIAIISEDPNVAKKAAETTETLIRANRAKTMREMKIQMDRDAQQAAVGAMTASYIRDGVRPSKAQAKALRATKDVKVRKRLQKRVDRAEKLGAAINERMRVKYGDNSVRQAREHLALIQRAKKSE